MMVLMRLQPSARTAKKTNFAVTLTNLDPSRNVSQGGGNFLYFECMLGHRSNTCDGTSDCNNGADEEVRTTPRLGFGIKMIVTGEHLHGIGRRGPGGGERTFDAGKSHYRLPSCELFFIL